jgi:hypothetical protein
MRDAIEGELVDKSTSTTSVGDCALHLKFGNDNIVVVDGEFAIPSTRWGEKRVLDSEHSPRPIAPLMPQTEDIRKLLGSQCSTRNAAPKAPPQL